VLIWCQQRRRVVEEEGSLFKAHAVNEEDSERDRARRRVNSKQTQ
jgi:hypothetical protein